MTEPLKYEDPTVSMSLENKALTERLMAQIMEKPESKKPQEVVSQIEKNLPQEVKKSQGFLAKFLDWLKNFFK